MARAEGLGPIMGTATYLDDIKLNGMAFLRVIRSPYARAKVLSMSLPSSALLGLTWEDIRLRMPAVAPVDARAAKIVPLPLLADGVANFVGQPVAALVAESREAAEDLAERAEVYYDPLEPSLDPLERRPQIHQEAPDNISVDITLRGGDEGAFQRAEVMVERRLFMARVVANPLEPKGAIARYHEGRLELFCSSQAPFRVRSDLSQVLGLPPDRILVRVPDVGGGFGNKVPAHAEYALVALAAMRLGRPVKWVEQRREHMTNPTQGKGVVAEVKLYATRGGRLLALEGTIVNDIGAYNFTINATMASFIARLSTGPYAIAAARLRALSVFTNLPPTGPYRGAGRPEAALVHESLIELLARRLGQDPIALRRRNLPEGEYVTPLGLRIDRGGYREVLARAEEAYRSMRGPGKGLALFAELIRIAPGEAAKVRLSAKGLEIIVGSRPHGQFHRTAFAKMASELLGIGQDRIEVRPADTDDLAQAVGSFGSRSISAAGAAVYQALLQLKEKLNGLSPDEAVRRHGGLEVETFFRGEDIFSAGAHVAQVHVDRATGMASLTRYFAADDVGRALNPEDVEAQLMGGALQGAAQVLWEEARFDRAGIPLYGTMLDVGFPTALDACLNFSSELVEVPSALPHGARGVGESGTIGGMAATFIALERALGVELERIPVTAEEALAALKRRGKGGARR